MSPLKIYRVLQLVGADKGVDVRFQPDFQMVLEDLDLFDQQVEVAPVELLLRRMSEEDVEGGLGGAVHPDDGVPLVGQQLDLVGKPLNFLLQVAFHLVISLGEELFLVRVLEDVPDALAFGGLQLLPEVLQDLVQMVGRLFGLATWSFSRVRSAFNSSSISVEWSISRLT